VFVLIARGRNTSLAARGFEVDATYFYMFNFSGQALKVHALLGKSFPDSISLLPPSLSLFKVILV
jgi:hypothetical protein